MAGLTPNGLVTRTAAELVSLITATILEARPGINLEDAPEQQIIEVTSDLIAEGWEGLQALYGALQGRGDGLMADLIAALTGTTRRKATKTRVAATVVVDLGKTLTAGAVAAIDGSPDDQFQLVADVAGNGATPVDAVFEALTAGPVAAPAGKLTIIVTPRAGWQSVTNAADAVPGRLPADDTELAATRVVELRARGANSYAAIEARVKRVAGVISATAIGNETSADIGSRPMKSVETVVWDSGAIDTAIAQSIYDSKPGGSLAYGTASANAKTSSGADFPIGFTRATVLRVYVAITVTGGASAAQIKQAIKDRGDLFVVAEAAGADELYQAVRNALPKIPRISALTIGVAPAPVTTLVIPSYAQIVRIQLADVAVTGVA